MAAIAGAVGVGVAVHTNYIEHARSIVSMIRNLPFRMKI